MKRNDTCVDERTEERTMKPTTVKMIRQGLFALPLLALGACGGARSETRTAARSAANSRLRPRICHQL